MSQEKLVIRDIKEKKSTTPQYSAEKKEIRCPGD